LIGNVSSSEIIEKSKSEEGLGVGFIGGILLFLFTLFKPKSVDSTFTYLIAMFWLFIFFIFWAFYCIDGKRIVNKPKYEKE
jgi:hypothetical protein